MIRSMTGYGRGSGSNHGFAFIVEMRSVNHRFADFALRLPRELYPLEERLRQVLQEEIKRGRVEVSVTLGETPAGCRNLMVNYDLAGAYHDALTRLSQDLGLAGGINLDTLIRLPDIINLQGAVMPEELVWPPLKEAAEEALAKLLTQREDEGEKLRQDLLERCRQLASLTEGAAQRSPQAQEESRQRVASKFKDFLGGHYEENRVLMECAILVERMGIDEELVRLRSHLDSFTRALTNGGPAGRKLDFIAQEMLREVNTIGSKAGDYALSSLVVEMKAELEKIREQIQNIE